MAVPEGHYSDVQAVLSTMKRILDERNIKVFDLSFNEQTKKVTIKGPTTGARVRMILSPVLARMLGMPETVRGECIGLFTPDIRRGFCSLYIYCDVIEPVVVGDSKVPLLRTVNIDGAFGDIIHRSYTAPIYSPLQKKHFDTVEINIMTDTGDPVPFSIGKSVVVLHFRRSSNPYFLST
jgi:hypothetical protein